MEKKKLNMIHSFGQYELCINTFSSQGSRTEEQRDLGDSPLSNETKSTLHEN